MKKLLVAAALTLASSSALAGQAGSGVEITSANAGVAIEVCGETLSAFPTAQGVSVSVHPQAPKFPNQTVHIRAGQETTTGSVKDNLGNVQIALTYSCEQTKDGTRVRVRGLEGTSSNRGQIHTWEFFDLDNLVANAGLNALVRSMFFWGGAASSDGSTGYPATQSTTVNPTWYEGVVNVPLGQ